MKRRRHFIILLLLLFLWQAGAPDSWAASRGIQGVRVTTDKGKELYLYRDYQALVVGISNYEHWPKLPNAANDAREVAGKLAGLGFQVKTIIDPTSSELKEVLNELVYQIGVVRDRAILLYFAGHGETETLADDTKMGFIIPRDCPLIKKDPMRFAACAISMRDIESVSMRIRSRHVIMLFDSCFSGSLFNIVRAVPDDITEKAALPVRQYITAGKEDEQVPDRSMFKRVFLNGLEGDADLTRDGYITGSELGMYLSDKVVNYTRRAQHPQYGKINNPSLDRGDFVFVPPTSADAEPEAPTAGTAQEKLKREAVRTSAASQAALAEKVAEPAKQPVTAKTPRTPTAEKPKSPPVLQPAITPKQEEQATTPVVQAKLSPVDQPPDSSRHLAAMTAPAFPPAGTRYAYRIQRLKESRIEKYIVLGEGTYEGKKVHQVKMEGKDGLVLYDLKTGNWMRTVVDGKTVGNADPYEDVLRYPLEVGNRFQSEFYYFDHALSGSAKTNVEVAILEEVRVTAGTFMAYQIIADAIFLSGTLTGSKATMPSRMKKLWYSPDLKIIVKIEDLDNRSGATTRTELVEYARADSTQTTVADLPKTAPPGFPPSASEKPSPLSAEPVRQAKAVPTEQPLDSSKHLAAITAPSFPPAGTRYAYRIQRLKESRIEKYVVLGEGTYEGRKVHQVRLEGKNGLVLYDLATGNWMRRIVDGKTVGNADPYEDILRYPLEVGNKHQCEFFYFDEALAGSGNTDANIEVVSLEELRVPAGTFMAYQISVVESLIFTGSVGARVTVSQLNVHKKKFWYAPDLKLVVKIEDFDSRAGVTTRTELVEYAKADSVQEAVADVPKTASPVLPPAAIEKPKPQSTSPVTQAKLAPAREAASPTEQLAALTAAAFPPAGTRYAYRIQRLKESRIEKYVVVGEGTYEGRKVHQVKIEGKVGLVQYDLKTGNWMRTVEEGKTIGSADPYEDILRYPLVVGNKHQCEFLYFDQSVLGTGNTKANVQVTSTEEVSVPAGRFVTFKITAEEIFGHGSSMGAYSYGMNAARRQKKFWYSPDINIVVKIEDFDNRTGVTTRTELLEYFRP